MEERKGFNGEFLQKYFPYVIIFISVLVIGILIYLFTTFKPTTIISEEGFAIADSKLTENLLNINNDTNTLVKGVKVEKFANLYQQLGSYYIGEEKKQQINVVYPLFTNSNAAIINLSDGTELINDSFKVSQGYKYFTLTSGALYNQGDNQRANNEDYLFLKLSNGLYINSKPIVIETMTKIYEINMNSILNFTEDFITYYTPVETDLKSQADNLSTENQFKYRVVNDIDKTTPVTINEKQYTYESLLKLLKLIDEPKNVQPEPVKEVEEEVKEVVPKPTVPVNYVKPTVKCENFTANVYSVKGKLEINDPAGVITKPVTFTFSTNNKIAFRKSFYQGGTADIQGLSPDTSYEIIGEYSYTDEYQKEITTTCLTQSIKTTSIDSLKQIELSMKNGNIYSNKIEVNNLKIVSDINAEAIKGIKKATITIDGDYFVLSSSQLKNLINQKEVDYISPEKIKSNAFINYSISFFDIKNNLIPIKNNASSTRTSKLFPTTNIKIEKTDITYTELSFSLTNPDNVNMQNYRYSIVSKDGTIVKTDSIPSSNNVRVTGLDPNQLFTVYTYSDFDLEDGNGTLLNQQTGTILLTTRSLTTLGYFNYDLSVLDLNFEKCNLSLKFDLVRTDYRLIELIDSLKISISTIDETTSAEFLVSEKNISAQELSLLKSGNEITIEFPSLTPATKYYINLNTSAKLGNTITEVSSISSLKSFTTTKRDAEVLIKNEFVMENLIDFDVKVYDPDSSILTNKIRFEVRDEKDKVLRIDTLIPTQDANPDEGNLRITIEALTPQSWYYFYFYADQYNSGNDNSTYKNNYEVYKLPLFTNQGISGNLQIAGLAKDGPLGKNLIDIYNESKWSYYRSTPTNRIYNKSDESMLLSTNNSSGGGNNAYVFNLANSNTKTYTITFKAKLEKVSNTLKSIYVYLNNDTGTTVAYKIKTLDNLSKSEWREYTATFKMPSTQKVGFFIDDVVNASQTVLNIKDLQVELGSASTPFEPFLFQYKANMEVYLKDSRNEISTNEYYFDIYKDSEFQKTLSYSDIDENNVVDHVVKVFDVDTDSQYKIDLTVVIKGRKYIIASKSFSTDAPIFGIRTPLEFSQMNPGANYVVLNDLDFTTNNYAYTQAFYGTIDFQGYKVTNSSYYLNNSVLVRRQNTSAIFAGLGKSGIIKNLVMEYKMNQQVTLGDPGWICISSGTSYGTIKNVKLTITESVNNGSIVMRGITYINRGTIENFVINLSVPVYGELWMNMITQHNYGRIRNGYAYGKNIIMSNDPVKTTKYSGLIYRNYRGGVVENVFSLVNVDIVPSTAGNTMYSNIVVSNNPGLIKNVYSVGDSNTPKLANGPVMYENYGTSENVYYVSPNIYTAKFNQKITSLALWDKTFQNEVLNTTSMWKVDELLDGGYYPQIKWPSSMPTQEFISLPKTQDSDLLDIISVNVTEQNETTAKATLYLNNPSGEAIESITLSSLKVAVKKETQKNEFGKTTIEVEFYDPTSFFSRYSVNSITSKTIYGTTYTRDYLSSERVINVEFYRKIRTVADWKLMKSYMNQNFSLENDLSFLGETNFWLTGSFTGKFDGKNHTISDVTINGSSYYGLFYQLYGATIKNLNVKNLKKLGTGTPYSSLIGMLYSNTLVDNVHLIAPDNGYNIIEGYYMIGGIASYLIDASAVTNSSVDKLQFNTLDSNGTPIYGGGIVGYLTNSNGINNCFATNLKIANSSSTYRVSYIGGIAGLASGDDPIYDCYSSGEIDGKFARVGGIVGYSSTSSTESIIYNNYSSMNLTSDYNSIGGIVGSINSAVAVNNNLFVGNVATSLNTASARAIIGNYQSFENNYVLDTAVINDVKAGTLPGHTSLTYDALLKPLTLINIVQLGSSFKYGEEETDILPKLYYEGTTSLIDNQIDLTLPKDQFNVIEMITEKNEQNGVIRLILDNPDDLEITGVEFDYLSNIIDISNIPETHQTALQMTVLPNKYLDNYILKSIVYKDSDGKTQKSLKNIKINFQFYKTIKSFADWQLIDSSIPQNYYISQDIDFAGQTNVKTKVKVARLEGNETTRPTLKNLNIASSSANYIYLIEQVTKSVSNVNFNNIYLESTTQTAGSYVNVIRFLSGTVQNVSISNITLKGPNKNYVSFCSFADEARFENVSLNTITLTGTNYVAGLIARVYSIIGNGVNNITANNITITSSGQYVGGLMAAGAGSNITVSNSNITGGQYVGGISGEYATGAAGIAGNLGPIKVINSNIYGSNSYIGGIAGYQNYYSYQTYLINSNVRGTTAATTCVGGIGGAIYAYNLQDSGVTDSNIISLGNSVGGLIGCQLYSYIYIYRSHLTNTNVTGLSSVGGIIGNFSDYGTITGNVINANVKATVGSGSAKVGGLIGYYRNINSGATTGSLSLVNNMFIGGNVKNINNQDAGFVGTVSGVGDVGGLIGFIDKDLYDPINKINRNYYGGNVVLTTQTGNLSFGIGNNINQDSLIGNFYVYQGSQLGRKTSGTINYERVNSTSTPTEINKGSYAKDNILVWYDGINNDGETNPHNNSPTAWKDISGGAISKDGIPFGSNLIWNSNGVFVGNLSGFKIDKLSDYSGPLTMEIVYKRYNTLTTPRYLIRNYNGTDNGTSAYYTKGIVSSNATQITARGNETDVSTGEITVTDTTADKVGYAAITLKQNGTTAAKTLYYAVGNVLNSTNNTVSSYSYKGGTWFVGNRSNLGTTLDRAWNGYIYSVRIHAAALSANDISINFNNDMTRYFSTPTIKTFSYADLKSTYTYNNILGYSTTYLDTTSLTTNSYPVIKSGSILQYQTGVPLPTGDLPQEQIVTGTSKLMTASKVFNHELPKYSLYTSDVDKINIEFDNIDTETNFKIKVGEDIIESKIITDKTYTLNYDFNTDFEVVLSDGITTTNTTYKKEELRKQVLVVNNNYYYIQNGKLKSNSDITNKEFINLYNGKGITTSGEIYDMNSQALIDKVYDNLSVKEDTKPLFEFELDKTTIHSFSNYSVLSDGREDTTREGMYIVKNNNLSIISRDLNIKKDSFIIDSYNGKDYETVLSTDNKLYSLKESLNLPKNFDNNNIKNITNNINRDGTLVLVEYDNGSILGFDYINGEIIVDSKIKEDISLFEYIGRKFTLFNSTPIEVENTYEDSKVLEKELIKEPIDSIINSNTKESNNGTTENNTSSGNTIYPTEKEYNYTKMYNPITKSFELYNTKELLNINAKEVISENNKIDSNMKLYNTYKNKTSGIIINDANGFILFMLIIGLVLIGVINFYNKTKRGVFA